MSRSAMVATAFSLLLAGCASEPPPQPVRPSARPVVSKPVAQNPVVTKPVVEPVKAAPPRNCLEGGFQPCEKMIEYGILSDKYHHRQGTLGEYTYTYYPGGSFGINPTSKTELGLSDWSGECKIDPINDRKICSLTNSDARLMIFYYNSPRPTSVSIFSHDFPGRTANIRVDRKPAHESDDDGDFVPSAIIPQLLSGEKIAVRYYEWPYDYPKDDSAEIGSLKEAMQLLSWARANMDKLDVLFVEKSTAERE